MRRLMASARARVLLAFIVLLAFASVLSTLLLREVLTARADQQVDDALSQEVDEFRRLLRPDGRNPETGRPFGNDVRPIFEVYLARNVLSRREAIYTFVDGRPYRSSRDTLLPTRSFDALEALGRATRETRTEVGRGDDALRALAVPVRRGGARRGAFVVTVQLRPGRREVNEAVRSAAGVSLFVLLLASGLAFVVSGRMLRPLRHMTDTARAISDTDIERRINVRGSDEVAELGRTFNAMLDRLQTTFDAQRAFLSDAGHDLRTPITIVRGHLELLGEDPAERAETLALVEDELTRMTRLVDDLMVLARSERPDFLRLEELDLDELTDELFAKASRLGDRAWELEQIGVGRLRGDRQRLTQAVLNLAVNAVQATAPGDRIAIGSRARPDGAMNVWVSDSGPGVHPEQRARIFERFARAPDGRRLDGSGLGLSITRVIAEAHGGTVELANGTERGATFVLTLPTETPPEVDEAP